MRKICFVFALIIVLAIETCAFGSNFSPNVEISGNMMKIYGSIEDGESKDILLRVIKKTDAAINLNSDIVYIEQKPISKDGKYVFYVNLPENNQSAANMEDFSPKEYLFSLGITDDTADWQSDTIEFYGENYQKKVLDSINAAKTAYSTDPDTAVDKVKSILGTAYKGMYMNAKVYESYAENPKDIDSFAEYLLSLEAVDSLSELKSQLNEAASVAEISENKNNKSKLTEMIEDEETRESLGISDSTALQSYNDFKDICGDKIVSDYANSSFSGPAESKQSFEFAVISNVLREAVTAYQIKTLLNTNKVLLGISASEYTLTDAEYMKLSGLKIERLSDVKAKLDEIIAGRNTVTTPSGSGGGGGGAVIGGGLASSTSLSPDGTTSPIFSDISDFEWARESIEYLFKKGVVSGRGDNRYEPADNVNREEFLKMALASMDIAKEAPKDREFEDVVKDSWYAGYVNAALNKGITSGLSETRFGIGEKITRQDASVMVYRALDSLDLIDETAEFSADFKDADSISGYASKAVAYMRQKEILSGYEDNTFRPLSYITRAESAIVIRKVMDYISRFYKGGISG